MSRNCVSEYLVKSHNFKSNLVNSTEITSLMSTIRCAFLLHLSSCSCRYSCSSRVNSYSILSVFFRSDSKFSSSCAVIFLIEVVTASKASTIGMGILFHNFGCTLYNMLFAIACRPFLEGQGLVGKCGVVSGGVSVGIGY